MLCIWGCFIAQAQTSDSDSDMGCGHSEAHAMAWHTFDLIDDAIKHVNAWGNNGIPIAVMIIVHDSLSESNLLNGKHCNMFIV